MEFETTTTDENGSSVKETHTLGEFATRTTTAGYTTIARENGFRKLAVTSETATATTRRCSPASWSRSWPHWTCPTA